MYAGDEDRGISVVAQTTGTNVVPRTKVFTGRVRAEVDQASDIRVPMRPVDIQQCDHWHQVLAGIATASVKAVIG